MGLSLSIIKKTSIYIILFSLINSCNLKTEEENDSGELSLISYLDTDGDGFTDAVDCAEFDENRWRLVRVYHDADGDGYGAGRQIYHCAGETILNPELVENDTDCDDDDNEKWKQYWLYYDIDEDGYGYGLPEEICSGDTYDGDLVVDGNDAFPEDSIRHGYLWTKAIGGIGSDKAQAVATDSQGNIFVAGEFSGVVDFDFSETVYEITSDGDSDTFLMKIHQDGSFAWVKQFNVSIFKSSLAVDGDDNIFFTGSYVGSVDFNFEGGGDLHDSNGGSEDIFITKINSDGTYGWTKTIGGSEKDAARVIAVDFDNNIIISGIYSTNVDFNYGGGEDFHLSNGSEDIFVTRINASGSYGWTKTLGGSDREEVNSVAIDGNNNIFVAGYFRDTVDFNFNQGENDIQTATGTEDIYVMKVNSDTSYGWVRLYDGHYETEDFQTVSLAIDSENSIYLASIFSGTVDFNFEQGVVEDHEADGPHNTFLSKIDENGSYGWTRSFAHRVDDEDSEVYINGFTIAIDGNDGIYMAGEYSGTGVDFNFLESVDLHSSYDVQSQEIKTQAFISKIDKSGVYGWTKSLKGNGDSRGLSIAVDQDNNVFMAGSYIQTTDFDFTLGYDVHVSTIISDDDFSNDVYIMKI